jgi:hypothetical protein
MGGSQRRMRSIAIKSFVAISLFGKSVPCAAPKCQIPITKNFLEFGLLRFWSLFGYRCLGFGALSFLDLRKASVVSLTLLYNDDESRHSRESGNPDRKHWIPPYQVRGRLIKSGMTKCVKFFLRQYTK